ncbi:hypothetical protein DCE79_10065 [Lysinibacillus sp. 2017]|uniref:hypothetical protein n=1 Tax=unclassified Lysinibacillus TaxID=2636778 RepID=UPI000D526B7B|nr:MULTISPECIES: hypothetical protein [unclassified Lysinibacillus]AWE07707.1 hypothetical protein DCE79_10065 [Lysinibacillus sp. 2017]TGN30776.1 hypothetical protein E4L99_17345 [Lysinibacillus sp. S2017]
MDSNYNCFIKICFISGDFQCDVSSDTQLFSFKSGIGFIAIPHFFSTLSSLYKGEIHEEKLYCHGNEDYYIFSSDGSNLNIEHIAHYPEDNFTYQFKLTEYIKAICIGFQNYLQQLEQKEILPLKMQEQAHPLENEVLAAFHDFSLLLNR